MSYGRVATIFRGVNVELRNNQIDPNSIILQLTDYVLTYHALMQIITRYDANFDKKMLVKDFTELLRERAPRILNTPICYTANSTYQINKLCIAIAKYCDRYHWLSLLMPDVSKEDIYGNTLDSLNLGQFILTDDKRQFISLKEFSQTAIASIEKLENDCFLTVDENWYQRKLTEAEMQRLGDVKRLLLVVKSCYVCEEDGSSNNNQKLVDELIALRAGLRKGDAGHLGTNHWASIDADHALLRFREYFDSLPLYRQEELSNIGIGARNFGEIFKRLFRKSNEYVSCLQELGRDFDESMGKNVSSILNLPKNQQEYIRSITRQLLGKIEDSKLRLFGDEVELNREQLVNAVMQCCAKKNDEYDSYRDVLLHLAKFALQRSIAEYFDRLAEICYEIAVVSLRTPDDRYVAYQNLFNDMQNVALAVGDKRLWLAYIDETNLLSKFGFSKSSADYYTFTRYKNFTVFVNSLDTKENNKEEADWKAAHPYLESLRETTVSTIGFFNKNKKELAVGAAAVAIFATGIIFRSKGD